MEFAQRSMQATASFRSSAGPRGHYTGRGEAMVRFEGRMKFELTKQEDNINVKESSP